MKAKKFEDDAKRNLHFFLNNNHDRQSTNTSKKKDVKKVLKHDDISKVEYSKNTGLQSSALIGKQLMKNKDHYI